jgi:hypothetical protein
VCVVCLVVDVSSLCVCVALVAVVDQGAMDSVRLNLAEHHHHPPPHTTHSPPQPHDPPLPPHDQPNPLTPETQVGSIVDLRLGFVALPDASAPLGFKCLHGDLECQGNIAQLCVQVRMLYTYACMRRRYLFYPPISLSTVVRFAPPPVTSPHPSSNCLHPLCLAFLLPSTAPECA